MKIRPARPQDVEAAAQLLYISERAVAQASVYDFIFPGSMEERLEKIWWKMVKHPDFAQRHMTCRMQTEEYRAKYIRPMPDDVKLPVSIEEYL